MKKNVWKTVSDAPEKSGDYLLKYDSLGAQSRYGIGHYRKEAVCIEDENGNDVNYVGWISQGYHSGDIIEWIEIPD